MTSRQTSSDVDINEFALVFYLLPIETANDQLPNGNHISKNEPEIRRLSMLRLFVGGDAGWRRFADENGRSWRVPADTGHSRSPASRLHPETDSVVCVFRKMHQLRPGIHFLVQRFISIGNELLTFLRVNLLLAIYWSKLWRKK